MGRVHSFITGSTVDGPGLRTVIWTTGCQLRCVYCQNPDTWKVKDGALTDVAAVVRRVGRYGRFGGGGVTVSGGEPLVQAPFVTRILRACRERGLHTALDTNGGLGHLLSDDDLRAADLVLLDLKAVEPELHRRVTGRDVEPVLRFARRLRDQRRPAWIRWVLVPGYTDGDDELARLGELVATLDNVERVEVLPLHHLGRSKWERLGRPYVLRDVEPPSPADVARVVERLRALGAPVP